MQNKFKFNQKEGIITLSYIGNQTYETVNELSPLVEKAAEKLRDSGKPILVLGDTTKMAHQDSGSRKAGQEIMTHIKLSKYALVITSGYLRIISQFIAKATGLEKKVKHFSKKEDALLWLKS